MASANTLLVMPIALPSTFQDLLLPEPAAGLVREPPPQLAPELVPAQGHVACAGAGPKLPPPIYAQSTADVCTSSTASLKVICLCCFKNSHDFATDSALIVLKERAIIDGSSSILKKINI
jgi:hypothetical protein